MNILTILLYFGFLYYCFAFSVPSIIESDRIIMGDAVLNNNVVIKNKATLKFKGSLTLNMKNFTIDAYYGKIIFEGDKNKVITVSGNGWKIKAGGYSICEFIAKYTKFINGIPEKGKFDNCIFEGKELNTYFEDINDCIFSKFKLLKLYAFGKRVINNSKFKNINEFISPLVHLKDCEFLDVNNITVEHAWSSSFLNANKVYIYKLLTNSIFNNVLNIHSRGDIKKTIIKNCGAPGGLVVRAEKTVSDCTFVNNIGQSILFQKGNLVKKEPDISNSIFINNKAYDAMIISGARYFAKNYFIKNKAKYIYKTIVLGQSEEVYGQNNCWGTTNKTWISNMIYDYKKDKILSKVKFTPLLDC